MFRWIPPDRIGSVGRGRKPEGAWGRLAALVMAVLFVFTGPASGRSEDSGPTSEPIPAMVRRNLFVAPDRPGGGVSRSPAGAAASLERRLLFTGVVITPQGRRALLEEAGVGRAKSLSAEGDVVAGWTLVEIGSNYVVVERDGRRERLRLFSATKPRPVPPSAPLPGVGQEPAPTAPALEGAEPAREKTPEEVLDALPGVSDEVRRKLLEAVGRKSRPPKSPAPLSGPREAAQ